MNPIAGLLHTILGLYNLQLFIYIVLSLLIHFRVVNASQPLVAQVMQVLRKINEPILSRIRKYLPKDLGVDLSPLIVFLVIYFIQDVLEYYFD